MSLNSEIRLLSRELECLNLRLKLALRMAAVTKRLLRGGTATANRYRCPTIKIEHPPSSVTDLEIGAFDKESTCVGDTPAPLSLQLIF